MTFKKIKKSKKDEKSKKENKSKTGMKMKANDDSVLLKSCLSI